jgi:ABC-2 type transport system permease protein
MGTWWKGTRLVFMRAFVETIRSRSFKILTGVMLVVSVAAVAVPQLLAQDTKTYTIATVGKAPAQLVSALDAAGRAGEFEVRYVTRPTQDELRTAVRDGDATVALTGDTLYTSATKASAFPGVVAQAAVGVQLSQKLAETGLTPQQLAGLRSFRPPAQVTVSPLHDQGRGAVGLAVGMVLNLALLFAGAMIATAVATEKSSRISEVLLAVLRPTQILTGTVLSIGTVTLVEILVLGAPMAVAVRLRDNLALPAVAAGDIALAVVWFLLGFAVYGFLFAAAGALADKVTDVNLVTQPISAVLLAGYLVSFFYIAMEDQAHGALSVFLSTFPLSAPVAMPLRWASGDVPLYQLLVSMVLTAATAVVLGLVASRVYRRALLITGHRVRIREVVGGGAPA